MNRYPVLIAIDDYNALYDYSAFEYRNQPYVFLILASLHPCIYFIHSVHARKLYLASLFRCFDEADYSPAQDRPYEPTRLHTPREPMGEVAEEQMTGDGRVCTFKNTLRNGLVIAALEKRYDHMVWEIVIIMIMNRFNLKMW